jgi:hypothetical protein
MRRRDAMRESAALAVQPSIGLRKRAHRRASLMSRAQQWLAARERLVANWINRAHNRARASMQMHVYVRSKRAKPGGAGAIRVPNWWEYESPLKRRLALEAMLRRMFSVVPVPVAA